MLGGFLTGARDNTVNTATFFLTDQMPVKASSFLAIPSRV